MDFLFAIFDIFAYFGAWDGPSARGHHAPGTSVGNGPIGVGNGPIGVGNGPIG